MWLLLHNHQMLDQDGWFLVDRLNVLGLMNCRHESLDMKYEAFWEYLNPRMDEEVPVKRLLHLMEEMRLVSHRLLKSAMAGVDKTGDKIYEAVLLYLDSLDPKVENCLNKLTKIIKSKERYGSPGEEVTYNFMEFK